MQKHSARFRKTLSIEDELELPEAFIGGDFVKAFSSINLVGSEAVGTKLIVKGTADIEAVCIVSAFRRLRGFRSRFRSFSICRTAARMLMYRPAPC